MIYLYILFFMFCMPYAIQSMTQKEALTLARKKTSIKSLDTQLQACIRQLLASGTQNSKCPLCRRKRSGDKHIIYAHLRPWQCLDCPIRGLDFMHLAACLRVGHSIVPCYRGFDEAMAHLQPMSRMQVYRALEKVGGSQSGLSHGFETVLGAQEQAENDALLALWLDNLQSANTFPSP